jgi:hypothetical protein
MSTHRAVLDLLEEKFVFRVSRGFFLLAAIVALLIIAGGVYYAQQGLRHAEPRIVTPAQVPDAVTVTPADVAARILAKKATNTGKETRRSGASTLSKRDEAQAKYGDWLDSLEVLLPEKLYTWSKVVGYYDYPYLQIGYHTKDIGFVYKLLEQLTDGLSREETDQALQQLCAVLREYPPKERREPFETYVDLYDAGSSQRKLEIAAAEAKYRSDKEAAEAAYFAQVAALKTQRTQGLAAVGIGVAAIAMTGVLLVLLAIYRHLKGISQLLYTNATVSHTIAATTDIEL